MKAQDLPLNNRGLRLGNKVLIDGKVCTVDHLYGQYIRTKEMPSIIDAYRDAYGIELTPEVLGWCGFTPLWHLRWNEYTKSIDEAINTIHFNFNDSTPICTLSLSEDNYDENINIGSFTATKILPIKHLHQLQNLYYSLTGEELTISLPTVKLEEK